ncbi:MAG: glycosyltransferase [Bacteroidota bacterium]
MSSLIIFFLKLMRTKYRQYGYSILHRENVSLFRMAYRRGGQRAVNTTIKEQLRKKYNFADDEKMLLFAATLAYEPNAGALATIISTIIPLLQKKGFRFRVIICGSLPPKKITELNALPCITAAGFVPSLDDLMQAADVFINPVVSGSGIQTKNIEAIASGCNVVATHFAATGLPVYLLNEKLFLSANNDWDCLPVISSPLQL